MNSVPSVPQHGRSCLICSQPVEACFGFVLARDILEKAVKPREFCAKCGLRALFIDPEDFLREPLA